MNRRRFLAGVATASSTIVLPSPGRSEQLDIPLPGSIGSMAIPPVASATDVDFWRRDRRLWMRLQETGEAFSVVYWSGGKIDFDNYVRLCYLFRDSQSGETVTISLDLFDLLYALQRWAFLITGKLNPVVLTGGYRNERHNAQTEGAAFRSEHVRGTAGDIKLPGFKPDAVALMAKFFALGGVGTYSTFTHVDTRRVRTGQLSEWVGRPLPRRRP